MKYFGESAFKFGDSALNCLFDRIGTLNCWGRQLSALSPNLNARSPKYGAAS
jgi:hypothetical protein